MSRILYIQYVLSQKTADLRRNSALDFVRARNQLDVAQYKSMLGRETYDTFELSSEQQANHGYGKAS